MLVQVRREFKLKVKVSARNIKNDPFWRDRPQECGTHDFVYAEDGETQLPPPLGEWMVTTETDDDRRRGASREGEPWLVVDQFMCTACLDEMEAHEEAY